MSAGRWRTTIAGQRRAPFVSALRSSFTLHGSGGGEGSHLARIILRRPGRDAGSALGPALVGGRPAGRLGLGRPLIIAAGLRGLARAQCSSRWPLGCARTRDLERATSCCCCSPLASAQAAPATRVDCRSLSDNRVFHLGPAAPVQFRECAELSSSLLVPNIAQRARWS